VAAPAFDLRPAESDVTFTTIQAVAIQIRANVAAHSAWLDGGHASRRRSGIADASSLGKREAEFDRLVVAHVEEQGNLERGAVREQLAWRGDRTVDPHAVIIHRRAFDTWNPEAPVRGF